MRYGIGLAVLDATARDHWAWTDVPAQGSATVQVAFKPERRGLHPVPPLTAETRFPLGTFRVWTVWRPAAQVLVYPGAGVASAAAAAGRAARRRRRDRARAEHGRVRRRAGLPARRSAEAGGLEEGRQGRRTGQPRHAAGPALRAVAGLRAAPALAGTEHTPVAPGGLGAAGRPAGPGLRPARCRAARSRPRTAKRTSGALPGRRWRPCADTAPAPAPGARASLPRDGRDTLFLLAGDRLGDPAAGGQPAAGGAARWRPPCWLWRGWLAVQARPLPGTWWLLGLLALDAGRHLRRPTARCWAAMPASR